jgi:methylated-DNA-[protein]-cysteine S-methyltransferase
VREQSEVDVTSLRKEPPSQRYCLVDTQIGAIGLAWSADGLTRLQLPEADCEATERRLKAELGRGEASDPPASIRRVVAALRRYCAGDVVDFAPAVLDLAGISCFAMKVYAAARAVPWGRTASYGELARAIAAPGAARAVGRALGHNPVAIIIPCHRILAGGGRIGGFSAFGGTIAKRRLLGLEGVDGGDWAEPPLARLWAAR